MTWKCVAPCVWAGPGELELYKLPDLLKIVDTLDQDGSENRDCKSLWENFIALSENVVNGRAFLGWTNEPCRIQDASNPPDFSRVGEIFVPVNWGNRVIAAVKKGGWRADLVAKPKNSHAILGNPETSHIVVVSTYSKTTFEM